MLNFERVRCVDCGICEEVCSFRFTDAVRPSVSAIRIGREGKWGMPFAMVCNLCGMEDPKCVAGCPDEALSVNDQEVVVWDDDKCTRCGVCVDVCPQQAVVFDEAGDRIIHCDMCGGEPLCIPWCPENVISR